MRAASSPRAHQPVLLDLRNELSRADPKLGVDRAKFADQVRGRMSGCQVPPHRTGKIPKTEIDAAGHVQDDNFAVEVVGNAIRRGHLKGFAAFNAHINICSIHGRHRTLISNVCKMMEVIFHRL